MAVVRAVDRQVPDDSPIPAGTHGSDSRNVIAQAVRDHHNGTLTMTLFRGDETRYFLRYRPGLDGKAEQVFEVPIADAYRYYADLDWIASPREAFPHGIPAATFD